MERLSFETAAATTGAVEIAPAGTIAPATTSATAFAPVAEMGKADVTRRDFLRGFAVAGTMAALGGGLTACAPKESGGDTGGAGSDGGAGARDGAGTGANAAADWLGDEPQIADADITETITTEVLVVGGGTAGLFAACSAAENGAKTLVIDKLTSGGIRNDLAALNSRYQAETGTVIDKQEITRDAYRYATGHVDQRLLMLWADISGEAIDWYGDRLAERDVVLWQEFTTEKDLVHYVHYPTGHSPAWPRGEDGQPTLDGAAVLTDYAGTQGVEFRYNTPMRKLIKEGDRIVGIIAEDTDSGGYLRIEASKGVIVSTGGYALNRPMLEALQPGTLKTVSHWSGIPGAEGDGIKACIWAGAQFDDVHTSMLFDRSAITPDKTAGPDAGGRTFWAGSQPFLKVNLNAERFANESGVYDFILHAAREQPMSTYCTIWDSNFEADLARFDTHGCSRMLPNDNGAAPEIPLQAVLGMMQGLLEDGFIQQADTIEELAQKLNIPADTFSKTVERYNELFDLKDDPDFGKESFRLSSLRNPPFFGVRQSGYILCTLDGIRINTNMNAIDTQGKPIEGLYVCGNDSGGYYADTYFNLATGHAAGRSVTFGRLAGRLAAQS